jgi:hypothetical protein
MRRSTKNGVVIYDNSNSGLKAEGVSSAIDYARGDGDLTLIAGEDAKTVCEGMDVQLLLDILWSRRAEASRLILVGERLREHAKAMNASWAADLTSAKAVAFENLSPGDRLLHCVKCFR